MVSVLAVAKSGPHLSHSRPVAAQNTFCTLSWPLFGVYHILPFCLFGGYYFALLFVGGVVLGVVFVLFCFLLDCCPFCD